MGHDPRLQQDLDGIANPSVGGLIVGFVDEILGFLQSVSRPMRHGANDAQVLDGLQLADWKGIDEPLNDGRPIEEDDRPMLLIRLEEFDEILDACLVQLDLLAPRLVAAQHVESRTDVADETQEGLKHGDEHVPHGHNSFCSRALVPMPKPATCRLDIKKGDWIEPAALIEAC